MALPQEVARLEEPLVQQRGPEAAGGTSKGGALAAVVEAMAAAAALVRGRTGTATQLEHPTEVSQHFLFLNSLAKLLAHVCRCAIFEGLRPASLLAIQLTATRNTYFS